jgi:hypothetical protein
MASIIVLFPLFLALMWVIRRDISRDSSRANVWIRRWAIIFTLFVAGATVAIDLITLLTTFLSGDTITLAFILKVLVVLLVASTAFMHFVADLWGYWTQFPARRNYVGIAVSALAILTILGGFFIVGTPQQARLQRFDTQKVNDLANIQNQVVSYWQYKQKLPSNSNELNNLFSGFSVPVDPQTSQPYEYRVTNDGKNGTPSFELCANFNAPNYGQRTNYTIPEPIGLKGSGQNENWQHAAGRVCFDRTIDTALYPPVTTPAPVKGY